MIAVLGIDVACVDDARKLGLKLGKTEMARYHRLGLPDGSPNVKCHEIIRCRTQWILLPQ